MPTTALTPASDGVWEATSAELHMAVREQMGREASPSAAVLDSQLVKSAPGVAPFCRRRTRRCRAWQQKSGQRSVSM